MTKLPLLASTLIAASALAVPAWATDYTLSKDSIPSEGGITAGGDGSANSPYYVTECGSGNRVSVTISGDSSIFTEQGTTVYLATDSQSFGTAEVNMFFASAVTAACDIVIGAAGVYITNGGSSQVHTFSGAISGSGNWTVTTNDVTQHYVFTGDLSKWTGNFTIDTPEDGDYVYYGDGGTAATNTSISGNGGSIAVDYGEVRYNYTGYADDTATALTVTNTSIEGHKVTFTGSVNYEVSSTITGWDNETSDGKSSSGSTLTISNTGTTTFSGAVSKFDIVTIGVSSTLAVGSTGSLDISGATVNISSTIQNSGTVTLNDNTTFVLGNMAYTGDWTSSDGATYTLITGSGKIYIGEEELNSENVSSLTISNVSSSSVTISGATFSYVDGTLSVTVKGETAPLGSAASNPYTSSQTAFDIWDSTWGAGSTIYITNVTSGYLGSGNNAYTCVADIVIGYDTTSTNTDKNGITLNDGYSGASFTFTGSISGEGNWTFDGSSHTPSQHYIFTGDLSGYSGNIDYSAISTTFDFGNGEQAATNTAVSGTGSIVVKGTLNYNYSGYADETSEVITISNTSLTASTITFDGSVNYDVAANIVGTTSITGTTLRNYTSDAVTISGNISDLTTLTINSGDFIITGDISVGGITVSAGSGLTIASTFTVAESTSFTLTKYATSTATITDLVLESGSTFALYASDEPEAHENGLYIGKLTINATAEENDLESTTSVTLETTHFESYINVAQLVGTNATLTLDSNSDSNGGATIFELGTSTNTNSESQFTGRIVLSDDASAGNTNDGHRAASLVISEGKIAAGAVIEMGTETVSQYSLSLGVNASTVEIAGLVSSENHTGGDIVYSGTIDMKVSLGNGGATLIDYKNEENAENFTHVGTNRNTLVINVAEDEEYSFYGVFLDMLDLEKKGAGTQSITFQKSQYGTSGYYFDGSITVKAGTLNLGGYMTATSIIVETGAILDLQSVTETQAGGSNTLYIQGGTVLISNYAYCWEGRTTNFGSDMYNGTIQISNGGVLEVTKALDSSDATGGKRGFSVTEGEGTYRYSGDGTSYIVADDSRTIHLGNTEDNATLIFDVVNASATLDVSMAIAYGMSSIADVGGSATTSTGALKKTGAGTLILSGTNLYSGGTTIKEGVLVAASASALGTGTISIEGGQLSISSSVTITNSVSVTLSEAYQCVSGSTSPTSAGSGQIAAYASGEEGIYAITGTGGTLNTTITLFLDETIKELLAEAGDDGVYFYLVNEDGISSTYGTDFTVSLDEALQDAYTFTYDSGILWIAAAPEPSMFSLFFGLGAIGLVATRRRRKVA